MTSVTGGFWAVSTDASRTKDECSAARPCGAAVSDLGMATPDRRSAATIEGQKAPGRLLYSSSETQATGRDSAAAHNARAIVLPAPTGPVATVSGHRCAPWAIISVIRGRCSAQSGTAGAVTWMPGSGHRRTPLTARNRPPPAWQQGPTWEPPLGPPAGPPGRQRAPHPHYHDIPAGPAAQPLISG